MDYASVRVGDILTHKTDGGYIVIVTKLLDGRVSGRYPDGANGGIVYRLENFLIEELETVQEHLRRNLSEMEFKNDLIREAKKRENEKDFAEMKTAGSVN